MVDEHKRYRLDIDFGQELYGLIEGYAEVQKISKGSFVRQSLSDTLKNELANMYKDYKPAITRKAQQ